jgi:hypothetical protein
MSWIFNAKMSDSRACLFLRINGLVEEALHDPGRGTVS